MIENVLPKSLCNQKGKVRKVMPQGDVHRSLYLETKLRPLEIFTLAVVILRDSAACFFQGHLLSGPIEDTFEC